MAKPFHWDFEARNVAFKLRVQASVHPSLTACTVSIPFLDANGALTGTVSASLDQGEVVQRQAAPRAAQFINLEKEIGAFNVSLDLVKGIQKAKLPISVTLDGAQQVVSEARICLGPLLLAGSPALSPETYRPGEPARSMRLRPTHSVSATFTESVGVAGLYSLEVSVITDKPMLSLEMMTRLMPACFRVEVLRGLPNEKSLPEQCEEVFVDVYPRLSSCSEALRETCPRMQSERRPHNKGADFIEPIVWLLGLAPPHAVREWMQHEGLVVEVHDRDPKLQGAAGTDPDKKKPIHGHGVVRFPLGPLLELETLELALRGDLVPCRGDKKQRRAEALSNDSLHAAGLLDEEGRQKMARRQGLDKREDTTDYHTLGTVCTLRAALAVPVPRHFKIQEEEEKVHRKHWESTEHVLDGHVFTAKTLGTSPKGHEKSPTATPTKWAPKAVPCRAKIGEVVGPWRRNQEEAEEDEELLQAADNLEHTQAIAHELIEAAPTGASGGLDCRFERYGRIFMVCAEGSDGEVTRAVLNCMHELNAELLGLNPEEAEFKLRQLSEEEQEDPHLDVLTGFCILDGRSRHFVIEGLREGLSWPKLLEVIPRGPDAPKLLHNSNIGFGERLYASFGPQLKQVKIRSTLEKLAGRSSLYSWNPSVTEADAGANEAPKQLMALKGLERLRGAREDSHWPRAAQIKRLQLLYGAFLSDQELEGYAAEEDVKVKKMKRNLDRRGSTCIDRRRSAFLEARKSVVLDARKSVAVGTEKGVLQEALAEDLTNAGTLRFQTRSTLKKPLDQTNDPYEQHTELKKTASMPNFLKTNKEQVREKSEANTRTFNYLGKKRDRETPFLEGAPNGEVYLYSSQKFNCTELQKDWMRKKMAGKDSEKYWSYNELYMSQNFDFAGAAPPGVPQLFPPRPNDTYARLESDNRPIFRGIHPRPKEAYRKPPRDVDPSRAELLHEPFEEAEWFRVAMGEDRAKPVRVEEAFEPYKVPHQRRYTENPFDAQHILMGEHHDFGPKSGFESVHYHGRAPGEGVEDTYLEPNVKEMEAAKSKIRFHHEMRFWSQCISRTGVTDLDRHELVLKDNPTLPLRGRVDEPLPESMRTMEVFHDAGRPDLEWHARLRENDSSAPIDVNTGAHIKRDHEVGFKKRACMSGKLTKAPWLHQSTLTLGKSKSAKSVTYMSTKDFAAFTRPPKSKFCEDQLWKNASRSVIKPSERESLPYKRPHHYGVHL